MLLESEPVRGDGNFLAVVFIVSLGLVGRGLNAFLRVPYFKCVWPFQVRIEVLASIHVGQALRTKFPVVFMFGRCERVANACSAKVRGCGKVGVSESVAAANR